MLCFTQLPKLLRIKTISSSSKIGPRNTYNFKVFMESCQLFYAGTQLEGEQLCDKMLHKMVYF